MALTSGKYPVTVIDPQSGLRLLAAKVGGGIHGILYYPDGTQSAEFPFLGSSGVALGVINERFDLSWAYDGKRTLVLVCRQSALGSIVTYQSRDNGFTFEFVA